MTTARRNVRKSTRGWDALLGAGYLLLACVLVAGAMAMYAKVLTPSVEVDLQTTSIGNALQKGSDVKLNGVPIGQVRKVAPSAGGATVRLSLDPEIAETLPADTSARLLPKTLFGERFVSLVTPASGSSATLSAGAVIHQDRSNEAIELEQVFDQLLPVLKALKPAKVQATLSELATTLRGQGEELGDAMQAWSQYLTKLNPEVDTMTEDFEKLGRVAQGWSDAAPDLLEALDTMRTTSRTLVEERAGLTDLYASVVAAADEMEEWVSANQKTVIVLSKQSRKALDAVSPYATEFPCVLASAAEFIDVMDTTLGKGTAEPGIHVNLKVSAQRGAYTAKDGVRYKSGGKARCPYTTGRVGSRRASASLPRISAPPKDVETERAAAGLGEANSPAENQLIAELMAARDGSAVADYPGWASLLVGPSLRGTEVNLW